MIVVDSSVWIARLRNQTTEAVRKLESIRSARDILVGDIVLIEVLQGARDDGDAARIEKAMLAFASAPMLDINIARKAAANFRILRAKGLRVRTTSDLIIGTFCIEHGHMLLHSDRDFSIMEKHLGLMVA